MPSALVSLVCLLIAVVCHEWAHAVVADRQGDPTPRAMGRLTFNPLSHMDWMGSVLVPLVSLLTTGAIWIAWAKPVPVNPRYFKHPELSLLRVALAGPLMNLTLALLASWVWRWVGGGDSGGLWGIWLPVFIMYNVVLMVFNMLPIPPLDGSKVLAYFLPFSMQRYLTLIEPYGFAILILLSVFRILQPVMSALLSWIYPLFGLSW